MQISANSAAVALFARANESGCIEEAQAEELGKRKVSPDDTAPRPQLTKKMVEALAADIASSLQAARRSLSLASDHLTEDKTPSPPILFPPVNKIATEDQYDQRQMTRAEWQKHLMASAPAPPLVPRDPDAAVSLVDSDVDAYIVPTPLVPGASVDSHDEDAAADVQQTKKGLSFAEGIAQFKKPPVTPAADVTKAFGIDQRYYPATRRPVLSWPPRPPQPAPDTEAKPRPAPAVDAASQPVPEEKAVQVEPMSRDYLKSIMPDGDIKGISARQLTAFAIEANSLRELAAKLVNEGVPVNEVMKTIHDFIARMPEAKVELGRLEKALIAKLTKWLQGASMPPTPLPAPKTINPFVAARELADVDAGKTGPAPPLLPPTPTVYPHSAASEGTAATELNRIPVVLREAVVATVAEKLKELVESRTPKTLTIRLDPPELGSLSLSIKAIGARVEATILANNAEVRALLEANREQLMNALAKHGLELGSMFVGHQSGSQRDDTQRPTQTQFANWRPEIEAQPVSTNTYHLTPNTYSVLV